MLERTAGCLESSSLRRLLPGSKKPLKSRRALHSGFWNHGAIELELSPLWTALIQGPDAVDQGCQGEQPKTSTGQAGMLLDFLYPLGTIRFLRQYSGWGFDRQDGRTSMAGFAKLGHRLYTSSAIDPSTSDQDAKVAVGVPYNTEDAETPIPLLEFLRLGGRSDYEEGWRQYSLLDVSEQEQLRLPLIEYLHTSNRIVDAERTSELFEQLNEKDRNPTAYRAAIRAYLRLENLFDACRASDEAVAKYGIRYGIPIGTDHLLAYMIGRSLWSHAFKTWQSYQDFHCRSPENRYNILSMSLNLPHLMARTFDLADYVSKRKDSPGLAEFASIFVRYLMSNPTFSDQSQFTKLLEILQCWGLDTADVYEASVQRFLKDEKNSKIAVRLYRTARRRRDVKFSLWVLRKLLRIFCVDHSPIGMQQILDDFCRFYGRPSRLAYQWCMRSFASRGDAETVHALFDSYTSRFQSEELVGISADEFAPILHVHAKRGELAAVVDTFNEIRDRYKLEPTILCWNIVLNAYGKLRDWDGCYACFEQLLETPGVEPDSWTYGTMLGVCASIGDRERTAELYKLADSLNIEKSTAMIDTLVITYIKDEYLAEAEKVCEDSLTVKLRGSRTRMWNHLLAAYGLRRDLPKVNRLLRRMSDAKVEYDQFTYLALMQALAAVRQPDRARAIMKTVMKEAGFRPTTMHYAVIMGGYIANGEHHKVFMVQREMESQGIRASAGNRLFTMKAAATADQRGWESGTEQQQSQLALQKFEDVVSSMDSMDITDPFIMDSRRMPLDIAYSTMFHNFIMFVLSHRDEWTDVPTLYEQYLKTIPEHRAQFPPVHVLSALMISKTRAHDYVGAQACWDLALFTARKQGRSLPPLQSDTLNLRQSATPKILPNYKLLLTEILTTQMISLEQQDRIDDIPPLVNSLLEEGFLLNNENWNDYVKVMARGRRYKLAFELCETILMPNWTGWARLRWQAPVRNRLPIEVRALAPMPKHYRAKAHTLLYLTRASMELQSMATESRAGEDMLAELQQSCPKTVQAIRTMQRQEDPVEREILRGYA